MSFLDHPLRIAGNNSYFAAMNSHRGFLSYFSTLFAPYRKYIIKGGPGCGKSTLMKKLAKEAEQKGMETIRYYCSSDSTSLDAVVIPALQIALLDGTPPHATEPYCIGAIDSLVNLSAFWQTQKLQQHAKEIRSLSKSISLSYQRVYHLMAAVCEIQKAIGVNSSLIFDQTRAQAILTRFFEKHRLQEETAPQCITRPASAFGVKGYVHFTSYERKAQTIIEVQDRVVYSEFFFSLLKETLRQKKISFEESIRPIDEATESVYLPQNKLLFTRLESENATGKINLDRMLPERGKGALTSHKVLLREVDSLCLNINEILHEIGKQHDTLESYYIAAADYSALNQFSEELINSILAEE